MKKQTLSLLPFLMILGAMLWVYFSGIYHHVSFDYLKSKHAAMLNYNAAHPFLSVIYFIGIYTISVCLVLPDSLFLSVLAGFLFPLPLAVLYIVLSETVGATLFMFAARGALKAPLSRYKSKKLNDFQNLVERDEVYYLLFFRFSHLLPFWLVNLGAAFTNVSKWTFMWTTGVGVLPLAIVLAQGGSELSLYFAHHTHFSMASIFTPGVKVLLLGLGVLSLIPLLVLRLRKK